MQGIHFAATPIVDARHAIHAKKTVPPLAPHVAHEVINAKIAEATLVGYISS